MGNSVGSSIAAAGRTVLHSLKLLAPSTQTAEGVECPICFLTYQLVNDVDCCHQEMCTDCFHSLTTKGCVSCPFCSSDAFSVSFAGVAAQPRGRKAAKKRGKSPEARPAIKAEPSAASAVKASVLERMHIEREMQKQRTSFSSDPYFSHPAPKPPAPRVHPRYVDAFQRTALRHGGRPTIRSARDIEERLARAGFFDELSIGAIDEDVSAAEELMIMEAIRLSLSDAAAEQEASDRRTDAGEATAEEFSPPPFARLDPVLAPGPGKGALLDADPRVLLVDGQDSGVHDDSKEPYPSIEAEGCVM